MNFECKFYIAYFSGNLDGPTFSFYWIYDFLIFFFSLQGNNEIYYHLDISPIRFTDNVIII